MGSLQDQLDLIQRNVPLGPLTTYKTGGPAAYFSEVNSLSQVKEVVSEVISASPGIPLLVLGRGSNLLVADKGFPGLVIKLGHGFNKVEIDRNRIAAGGSVTLPHLARKSVNAGLTGLEFYVGIPGSVGGGVRQNAGCLGSETSDVLVSAQILDLETGTFRNPNVGGLGFGYRQSNVTHTEVVLSAEFACKPGDIQRGLEEMKRVTRWRKENQPGGTLNAGSVFKNPVQIPAGELIDSLGFKGLSVGKASVSHRHANFFEAESSASSEDIWKLMKLVQKRVQDETGVTLEPEIQFVGFDHDD